MKIQLRSFCLLLSVIIFSCSDSNSEKGSETYPKRVTTIPSEMASGLATKIRAEVAAEIDPGLELSLWASDTLVNDPVAISIDDNGRVYYTLGTRITHSEFDIRGHRDWMTASISFQSVEDRRAFIKKTFSEPNEQGERFLEDLNKDGVKDWRDLTVEKEQVWIVSDADGDGYADRSQLFIEDFHEEITDLANGVEYHDGEVFLSVGPDLWRIKDTDGDDIANKKESISHGFGVHIGFGAHGMSGVKVGPQGRIWWGIGDIGMNVVDQEGKRWKYPNRGVVVRADPDGSNFEVYASGVRNTHEFVFDKYGNLISEDNDGDHQGERERLVYLINGSDTGWRINWQFGKYTDPDNNKYKVWMDEGMGIPRWEGQAAYFLPPIINYVNGPTGMVYNPGTALGPEWYDHFFISEFRGSPANSPIHAFTLAPDGASFKLAKTKEIAKGLLATGLDFGPDGALYFGDWIDGWDSKRLGRLWKLDIPNSDKEDIREEVKLLMASKFGDKKVKELKDLLSHQDMRIRKKAQFELVRREALETLIDVTTNSDNQLARIHGIWGLGQLARTSNINHASSLVELLSDGDPEIITQAAKMLGDVKFSEAAGALTSLLVHPSPRVQLHVMEALGRMEYRDAFDEIISLVETNDDVDTWLRHAAMVALGRLADEKALGELESHKSEAVKIVAVVALRRMRSAEVSRFLDDPNEYIVAEAARAINDDFSIDASLPDLANILTETKFTSEPLIRRAINANLRLGEDDNLKQLTTYAANQEAPVAMRVEALEALGTWAKPSLTDRVDGRFRGEKLRDEAPLRRAVSPIVNGLLIEKKSDIQIAATKLVGRLKINGTAPVLATMVRSNKNNQVRKTALEVLALMSSDELEQSLEYAIKDKDSEVRSAALAILPKIDLNHAKAIKLLDQVLKIGVVQEQQAALAALGNYTGEAVQVLSVQLDKLVAGRTNPEIALDILDAIKAQNDSMLVIRMTAFEQSQMDDTSISGYRYALDGGDLAKGRTLFYEQEAAQCVKCHSIFELGGNAGPGLKGLSKRLSKEKILESMVAPSAVLAKGYGIAVLKFDDDRTVSGIVIEENESTIKLSIGKEDIKEFNKENVVSRQDVPSSMPLMGSILTKREIRDLVAFLSKL